MHGRCRRPLSVCYYISFLEGRGQGMAAVAADDRMVLIAMLRRHDFIPIQVYLRDIDMEMCFVSTYFHIHS
jgi:hypothetical protein